ncbi:toll/interleukin-1 receptor domain-containing protein [Dactylosporangium sp. CA-092794]|uniref:toll/interleukin-1 receptor domain-containing protein n=1 Tax=Dactylosporangium sp. CA-092794 TaxID=3239929 RepID=UPI003D933BE4
MARVFISHASSDSATAAELHRQLVSAGHEVFLDLDRRDGLLIGDDWEKQLYQRLRWADSIVSLVSDAYLGSQWSFAEVAIAKTLGVRLLPLSVQADVLHPLLVSVQHADFARDPGGAVVAIIEALRGVDALGGEGWPDDRSPYPGLRAFDVGLRRAFFGRATEIDELAGLVRSSAREAAAEALVVVGPSGCGKSSLVRAGVVPVIAADPEWWALGPMVPGADPVGALVRELVTSGRMLGLVWTLAGVRERLAAERGLVELVDELLLAAPGSGRRWMLLVVDQFEELLTRADGVARQEFAAILAPALGGSVTVTATLRPEFLAGTLANRELATIPLRVFTLRPMNREALAMVIEGPARLAGISVDPGLVQRLVADTDTGEALPLLAFTLQQLAIGVHRGGHLSEERYEQLGGVAGALVGQADAALAEARAASGRTTDAVIAGLLHLVTVDDDGNPTRARVRQADLTEQAWAELDAFAKRRLVTTDRVDDDVVVGVAHEAFLSAWPPLAHAIESAGSALRRRRELELAAAEWSGKLRPADRLWTGGHLAATVADLGARLRPTRRFGGRKLLMTDTVQLTVQGQEFLTRSIRHDRAQRGRLVAVLSTLLVLALAAAGAAFAMQRNADHQRQVAQAQQRIAEEQRRMTADTQQRLSGSQAETAESKRERDVIGTCLRLLLEALDASSNGDEALVQKKLGEMEQPCDDAQSLLGI